MNHPLPDGSSPFDPDDCGHLPCPPWLNDSASAVAVHDPEVNDEPELDPPHHVHDLWIALGLGEE